MQKAEIGIIGGGVIGCAIARQLSGAYGSYGIRPRIIVIEKNDSVGMETSRLNSGVIHSGFHQEPGSLKARLAFRGSQLIEEYARKNLPSAKYRNCGMLIVISSQEVFRNLYYDLPNLLNMRRRGKEQGINFKFLGPRGVRKIEPNIRALGGIFIPQVSVINSVAMVRSLYRDAISERVNFRFNNKVKNTINIYKDGYIVYTDKDEYFFKCLINSAGLYADQIALMVGINKYKIYPWRGEYYELVGLPKDYIKTLVYPAVSKDSPGKGIHFRPLMDDKVLVGPSAKLVGSVEDYENGRLSKEVFLRAAQRFFPEIKEENLMLSYSGIRPKLREDGAEDDFVISLDRVNPPLINLIGIESPGLSASMAIAENVHNILTDINF